MDLKNIQGSEIKLANLNQGLVVIEFYGNFCTSCLIVEKSLETLAEKYQEIRFFKISAINDLKFAQDLDVSAVPTVFYFKDGKKILGFSGYRPLQHLEKAILVLKSS